MKNLSKISDQRIGVAGLSHLGLITALSLADKKFLITALVKNKEEETNFLNGNFQFDEPDVLEVFNKVKHRLRITSEVAELNECDVIFIANDVPTNDNGESNLGEIEKLINQICSKVFCLLFY